MSKWINIDDLPNGRVEWDDIFDAPSIDIVRCKECKWSAPNREGDYDCKCHIPTFRIKVDDFCSCGERESE
jgi:hypothetical protein